jgi:glycosyltransferase involved in cell wall biosynthesis
MEKYRLAILTTHPIQYQAPLWQVLATDEKIESTVFLENDFGVKEAGYDKEFGKNIQWDIPLLEGYNYVFLRSLRELIQKVRTKKFDAVLVHNWNHLSSWFVVFAARRAGVKVMLRGESPWKQEAAKSPAKLFLKRLILRRFFKRVDAFLYIGEENKKFYLAYGVPKNKLFFAPYAVQNDRFMRDAEKFQDKAAVRRAVGLPENTVTVIFTGKLIEKKQPMEILRAYSDVASKDTALVFVGDGHLRASLELFVELNKVPNVIFTGFKNQTEIPTWYAAADIFTLYSGVGETWGLSVNEAMCFGLPVVISDLVGCAPDLARDNGFVVSANDTQALSKAFKDLFEDKALRESFSVRSRAIVQNYSFDMDRRGILLALEHILEK